MVAWGTQGTQSGVKRLYAARAAGAPERQEGEQEVCGEMGGAQDDASKVLQEKRGGGGGGGGVGVEGARKARAFGDSEGEGWAGGEKTLEASAARDVTRRSMPKRTRHAWLPVGAE